MTKAQRDYLAARGRDPWSLTWADARDLGQPEWGTTEAARLPDGNVLLANGTVSLPSPAEETRCVCRHEQSAHRPFGGLVAYAECTVPGCDCKHYVQSPAEETR